MKTVTNLNGNKEILTSSKSYVQSYIIRKTNKINKKRLDENNASNQASDIDQGGGEKLEFLKRHFCQI